MNKKGFTLIELLVVVLIIGILAAIAVPKYQKAVGKSKASQAITMLGSLLQAQESFYLANGHYTNDLSQLDITIPLGTAASGWAEANGQSQYMYSCLDGGHGCVANIANNNLPLFQRSKAIYWCIGKGFGNKTQQASDICAALGGRQHKNNAAYYDMK